MKSNVSRIRKYNLSVLWTTIVLVFSLGNSWWNKKYLCTVRNEACLDSSIKLSFRFWSFGYLLYKDRWFKFAPKLFLQFTIKHFALLKIRVLMVWKLNQLCMKNADYIHLLVVHCCCIRAYLDVYLYASQCLHVIKVYVMYVCLHCVCTKTALNQKCTLCMCACIVCALKLP